MLQIKDVYVIRYFYQRYYDVEPFSGHYRNSLHFHVDHIV